MKRRINFIEVINQGSIEEYSIELRLDVQKVTQLFRMAVCQGQFRLRELTWAII